VVVLEFVTLMHQETKEITIKEYLEIIDALFRRDIVNAKELMRKHIENSKIISLSQLSTDKQRYIEVFFYLLQTLLKHFIIGPII
jgi:DNA-binding GntR family transcriptional regulator